MDDDQMLNKVVIELSNFYRAVTAPFLNRMPDNEKEKALLWTQKVLDLRNYDSMVKYLTFLSFMIIRGHLVTPFDTDPRNSQMPPLPVHFGEGKMLDYIEKVVAQCQSVQDNENDHQCPDHSAPGNITTAVSSDELAFLSSQPTPGVGIRLYMATSAQPFSMWSKAEGAPQATKYDVPAKDVIERGLSLAKDKFYSYLEEIEKQKKCSNCSGKSLNAAQESSRRQSVGVGQQEARNQSIASRHAEEEDFAGNSLELSYDEPGTSRGNQNAMPAPTKVAMRSQPTQVPSPADPPFQPRKWKRKPPEPMSEEDRRIEAEVQAKSHRWFANPQYDLYREEINNFIRGGTRIDTIRRSVHKIIRKRFHDPRDAPLFTLDSTDEEESWHDRVLHLQKRYVDVLEKEFGITHEGELYYLTGVAGLSGNEMSKARKIIEKAEEGLVDGTFRQRFQSGQGRTCGRLMSLIDELLDPPEDPSVAQVHHHAPTAKVPHQAAPAQANQPIAGPSQTTRAVKAVPVRRLKGMPPTSVLGERSSDADHTPIENEPEPAFFRNMNEFEDSKNNTQNESNQSFDLEREQPPDNFYNLPDTSQESNEEEPDGRVYPYCPRENC